MEAQRRVVKSPGAATPVLTPRDLPPRTLRSATWLSGCRQRLLPSCASTRPSCLACASACTQGANKQVTDRAGDVWSNFESTDAALYQVQIDHAARPSVAPGSSFFPAACVRSMLRRRAWYWCMSSASPGVRDPREFPGFFEGRGFEVGGGTSKTRGSCCIRHPLGYHG